MILNRNQIDDLFNQLETTGEPIQTEDAAWYLLERAKDFWRHASLLKSIHGRQKTEQGKRKN